jgi:dolichol-phosphate mannosyltransferase
MENTESNLTIVLPTLNEEQTIGLVIDEIRSLPVLCDILVVDSSTDNTPNIALRKGVKVIRLSPLGKGYAMRIGFKEVSSPYVVMMDADLTYPADIITATLKLLMAGYDAVVGYRSWKQKDSMTSTNSFGNKVLSLLASILYRRRVKDVCSGMWSFRKEALDKFNLRSSGFTLEAELFTEVVRHKCKLAQIPILYRARPQGSKAKLKVSDGFKIGWFLIKSRWMQ